MGTLLDELEHEIAWDTFKHEIFLGFMIVTCPVWFPFWILGFLARRGMVRLMS